MTETTNSITLRAHLENQIAALKEVLLQRIETETKLRENYIQNHLVNEAVTLQAQNRRLDGMNELREQINVERADYVKREMFDGVFTAVDARIDNNFTTMLTKCDKSELAALQAAFNELVRKGSDHAQQALGGVQAMEKRIQDIERDMAGKAGARDSEQRFADTNTKLKWSTAGMILGSLGVLTSVMSVIIGVVLHFWK